VKIAHHLDDATMLALAAGTLNQAHSIVAAAHVALCQHCQSTLKKAESIGGGLLALQTETPISQNLRAATLASLDGAKIQAAPKTIEPKPELPRILANALGQTSLDHIKWNRKLPGVLIYDVPLPKGTTSKLKLLSLQKGKAMPDHGHGGEELTLVLRGSYSDKFGRFAAGDVADLADDVEHQPIVDSDENCICLISFDVPAKFKTILARLVQPFSGM
jgi:putative transcriptional regulator